MLADALKLPGVGAQDVRRLDESGVIDPQFSTGRVRENPQTPRRRSWKLLLDPSPPFLEFGIDQ